MKKPEIVFNLSALPVDIIMFLFAAVIGFSLRPGFEGFLGPAQFSLALSEYLLQSFLVLPLFIFLFAVFGLYSIRFGLSVYGVLAKIANSTLVALCLLMILFFFDKDIFPSRFIILASWAVFVVLLSAGRVMLSVVQKYVFKKGFGLHKIILLGDPVVQSKLVSFFSNKENGYNLISIVGPSEIFSFNTADLREIDEIFCIDKNVDQNFLKKAQIIANDVGARFSFLPGSFDASSRVVEVDHLFGRAMVISIKNSPLDGWGLVIKNLFDFVVSLFLVFILSPLFVVLYFFVKFTSVGSVIFTAYRVGKDEKSFLFYKFRTMYQHLSTGDEYGGEDANNLLSELREKNDGRESVLHKIKNDPRVTPIGRFLRKSKLDELPQFFNVIKGDMSLVGPRPHLIEQVRQYKDEHPRLFSIKPGIFGLTQLEQLHNPEISFEEEVSLDVYYIQNWSLWLDIKILFMTAIDLVLMRGSKDDY